MFQGKNRFGVAAVLCGIIISLGLFGALVGGCVYQSNRTASSKTEDDLESNSASDHFSSKTEYRIVSKKEKGEWVVVETTYGSFKYPFAFSDLINVEAVDLGSSDQLRFFMDMDGIDVPLYTVYYNSNDGRVYGTLVLSDCVVTVSADMEVMPDDLSADWQKTFYAAQETLNSVIFSMEENEHFIMVE